MSKTMSLKCTSAFVVGGKIITPEQVVHDVPKADALNLIQRGKAEEVLDGDDPVTELPALEEMTVPDLRKVAEEYEIEGAANMKKADLIEAIEAAEGDGE
jgi:hypothetical protein